MYSAIAQAVNLRSVTVETTVRYWVSKGVCKVHRRTGHEHLYSEIVLSRKPFAIRHMYIYTFLLRMTNTMTSQNIDISYWDIL
jgi:hypothetical protein